MRSAAIAVILSMAAIAVAVEGSCRDLGIVIVNDVTMWRQYSTQVEAITRTYFDLVATMFADSSSNEHCIVPHLIGQVTLTKASSDSVRYRTCAETGQCQGVGVMDPGALLDDFTELVSDDILKRTGLRPHLALLLTVAPFPGLTRGLSNQNTLCTDQARAVISVSTGERRHDAQIIAHEIGHILGMTHSSNGSSIMAPQSSARSVPTTFSPVDIKQVHIAEPCHTVVNVAEFRCGNGIVDSGEECDPGLSSDRCCSNTCQILPECRCPESDPCCEGGRIVPAGQLCRPNRDNTCDKPEFCNGVDSRCPLDEFSPAGTPCGDDSVCFDGECVANRQQQCRASELQFSCGNHHTCRRLYCSDKANDEHCPTFIEKLVARGTPCGAGFVCIEGDCVESADADAELAASALARFEQRSSWHIMDWGPCESVQEGECRQSRHVSCQTSQCSQPSPASQRVCSCPVTSRSYSGTITIWPLTFFVMAIVITG